MTPECLHFLCQLISSCETRIGKNGLQEITDHPWFAGLDWERLQELPAPHKPESASEMVDMIELLRDVDVSDPRFAPLVQEITKNFDNFDDDGRGWDPADRDATRHHRPNEFLGYTYRRKPATKGRPQVAQDAFSFAPS